MKLFRRIDVSTGYFIEDVPLESHPVLTEVVTEIIEHEDGTTSPVDLVKPLLDDVGEPLLDPQYVDQVPTGLYTPKWDGSSWVEGGIVPEPPPVIPSLEARVAATENKVLTLEETLDVLVGGVT